MSSKVNIPDFDFSGFYYGEILDALLDYMRRNVPEISNTSPYEPAVQIMRATALVGHLNNTLLDMVANESMLPSAQLRESVVRLLALIGYVPKANIPAQGFVRTQLNKTYTTSTLIIPNNAQFATKRKASTPSIIFEADNSITINRTDQMDGVWDMLLEDGPFDPYSWIDWTAAANVGAFPLTLLMGRNDVTPGGPQDGSTFYCGHASTLTDSITFEGITAPLVDFGNDQRPWQSSNMPIYVWEYFDGSVDDSQPDEVAISGPGIRFEINTLFNMPAAPGAGSFPLDQLASREGLWVRVNYNVTNFSEWVQVEWDEINNVNYVTTSTYLGQVSPPSIVHSDYTIGTYWHQIPDITDGTAAVIPVTGELFFNANGIQTVFPGVQLQQWPLQPDTRITWHYDVGGFPKQATLDIGDGTIGGDAAAGTEWDASTGFAILNTQNPPDAGDFYVDYVRVPQPFQQDGKIQFKVPMTDTEDWRPTRLDDAFPPGGFFGNVPNTDGYWIRFRLVQRGSQNAPPVFPHNPLVCQRVKWDQEHLFLRVPVTQGETYENEILGSGNGTATQKFVLGKAPVLNETVDVSVDGSRWYEVPDFVSADPTDEVYTVRIDSDGAATVQFGDGTNGKACPSGTNNVTAEYRVGGADDGNVGSDQITINRSGLSRIRSTMNPRSMTGWSPQEGSGGEDELEKLKRDGVASLRTLERAVTPADYQYLADQWVDVGFTNQSPFSRSLAIENGYGPKTIKLVLVPNDGIIPSNADVRQRLDVYFNGDADSGGIIDGVGLVNTEVQSKDYVPVTFVIEAEISGGDKDAVQSALFSIMQPEAKEGDEETYRWRFGQTISTAKLLSLIFGVDQNIDDVTLLQPATAITLGEDELPLLALLDIVITEV